MEKKRILIAGATSALGQALSLRLAQLKYDLVIHYHSRKNEAEKLVHLCLDYGVSAEMIYGDFSSLETTQHFLKEFKERFQHLYGFINNIGTYLTASSLETSLEDWYALFQSNLHLPFILSKELSPYIIQEKGVIIYLGMCGSFFPTANLHATGYRIAKLGLVMMMRSVAKELANHGVRVNMISPGYMEESIDYPHSMNSIPFGRYGKNEDILNTLSFLLSSDSQYIIGQNIEVAGGVSL